MDCPLFPDMNHLMMRLCLIFKKILLKINMAYQKTMAIRDYLAFSLRSVITECIKKTMAIDRKKA